MLYYSYISIISIKCFYTQPGNLGYFLFWWLFDLFLNNVLLVDVLYHCKAIFPLLMPTPSLFRNHTSEIRNKTVALPGK